MSEEFKYSAFISYSHSDAEWASWLHRALETYRTPRELVGQQTERGHLVPANLFPVFRDRDELPTSSDLSNTIQAALKESRYLVVLCSARSARSPWVDAEIRHFKSLGREGYILCLIVDGEPNAADKSELAQEECFPNALRFRAGPDGQLTNERAEPLAADVRKGKDGKADALLKIIAGLLGVNFAELKRRDLIRQRRLRMVWATAASVLVCVLFSLLLVADHQRNDAMVRESRFLSGLSVAQSGEGNASGATGFALAALPRRLNLPERPFVPEAEFALERSVRLIREQAVYDDKSGGMSTVVFSPDGKYLLSAGYDPVVRIRDRVSGEVVQTLKGHVSGLASAAYSPDGQRIVTSSADGTVKLWNAASATEMHSWTAMCLSVAFSADGRKVAAGCQDGTALVWDANTFEKLASFRPQDEVEEKKRQLAGNDPLMFVVNPGLAPERNVDFVTHVAFSPDSAQPNLLLTYRNAALLVEVESGRTVRTFSSTTNIISAVFSPDDGSKIVTADTGGDATLWNRDDGEKLAILPHGYPLHFVTFAVSPTLAADHVLLATAGDNNAVLVWDLALQRVILQLGGNEGSASAAAFTADGLVGATSSADGTIRVWNLAANGLTRLANTSGRAISTSSLSADGKSILTGSTDGSVRLWDLTKNTNRQLGEHSSKVTVSALAEDGKKAVTAADLGKAMLWDLTTGKMVASLGDDYEIHRAMFAANDSLLMTATTHSLRIWDGQTGAPISELTGEAYWDDQREHAARELKVDGQTMWARLSDNNTVRVYGRLLSDGWILSGHAGKINSLVASYDSTRLATASEDGTARLWRVMTGTLIAVLKDHHGPVRAAEFSPDGKVLATASDDGTAILWDGETGTKIAVLAGHHGPVNSLLFSEDGSKLVTTSDDQSAMLWNVQGHTALATLAGQDGAVNIATFCEGGKNIVTGAANGTARVWDSDSGKPVSVLKGHTKKISAIYCEAGNDLLLTGSEDLTIREWDKKAGAQRLPAMVASTKPHFVFFNPICPGNHAQCIISVEDNGKFAKWDAGSGRPIDGYNGAMFSFSISAAAVSANGKYAAAGLLDGTVRLWDTKTGKELAILRGHASDISAVMFSPDGTRLASVSAESTRVWDVERHSQIAMLPVQAKSFNFNLTGAFSATGAQLAIGSLNGTLQLWDGTSASPVTIPVGPKPITSIAFAPQGDRLVVASADGLVRIIDTHTRSLIDQFDDGGGAVASAALDQSGRVLIAQPLNDIENSPYRTFSAPGDGVVRVWMLPPHCQELIDLANRTMPRRLGPQERQLAFLPDNAEPGSTLLSQVYSLARPLFGWILGGADATCH